METYNIDKQTLEQLKRSIDNLVEERLEQKEPGFRLCGVRYLNGDEVCRLLGIDPKRLKEFRDTGKIGYFRPGGGILYREEDVKALIEKYYNNHCH